MLTRTDRTQRYTITPVGRDFLKLSPEDWNELWDDHDKHGSRLFTLMALSDAAAWAAAGLREDPAQTVWSIVCHYIKPQLSEDLVRPALHELVVAGLVVRAPEPEPRARKHRGIALR